MTRTVGLTGGIGSGKSTAAGFLAELGASVVDADEISRGLTAAGGAALGALREAFGEAMVPPGGALDRDAMRALAFSDPAARARLEAILHPLVREASARRVAAATGPYAVLVVPLLFESGSYAGRLDRVVVVDLDESLQVRRTVARSGLAARGRAGDHGRPVAAMAPAAGGRRGALERRRPRAAAGAVRAPPRAALRRLRPPVTGPDLSRMGRMPHNRAVPKVDPTPEGSARP